MRQDNNSAVNVPTGVHLKKLLCSKFRDAFSHAQILEETC